MNILLEHKILEEINSPANQFTSEKRMGEIDYIISRNGQTRVYVMNAWDSGMHKINVGGDCIMSVEGGARMLRAHPSYNAYSNIVRACEARDAYDRVRGQLSNAEEAALKYLGR